MNEFVSTAHALLRATHITLGFVGLALFWIIVVLPKGTAFHLRLGRAFAKVTWIVGGSAIVSSIWALAHLDSFAPTLAGPESAGKREIYQFIFAILLYLSVATVSGTVFGVLVMRKRDHHDQLRESSLPVWFLITGLTAVGLIGLGVWGLAAKDLVSGGMPWEAYLIPVVVGLFGIATTWSEWNYVAGPAPERRSWLYRHVWHMCGTGVAFHTAFLVFGANRLFGYQLPGAWALLPWVGPPLIGMSLTTQYIRRLRQRMGDSQNEAVTIRLEDGDPPAT